MAAISQNRWPVHGNQLQLHVLPWVTGRVVGGDVWTVLDYLCRRYNAEVERIDRSSSWGWAYRPIRGALTGLSNHASATAVDLNADKHPLGVRGTFTPQQKAAVRRILADIGTGILRWGEDYIKRVDGMHFELNVGPGDPRLAAAAKRIRNGQASGGNPGLPTTGDGPTVTKPTTPIEEDTLSAAEIADLKAHMTELAGAIVTNGFQRKLRNEIKDETALAVAAFPINRGGKRVPWIQDTADTRTAVATMAGELSALRVAVIAMAGGTSVDYAAVEAAAKRGTEAALEQGVSVDINIGGAK